MDCGADVERPDRQRAQRVAASALLFLPDNSGGIVGHIGTFRATAGCAASDLRLAALEVLPQRRGKTLLAPLPLRVFRTIGHFDPVLAPIPPLWQGSARSRPL